MSSVVLFFVFIGKWTVWFDVLLPVHCYDASFFSFPSCMYLLLSSLFEPSFCLVLNVQTFLLLLGQRILYLGIMIDHRTCLSACYLRYFKDYLLPTLFTHCVKVLKL